jgi:hypothetical protein
MVSTVQAATGYTTGQIGMLYRMNLTGANGVTGYGDWSISGSNFILTLNNISNMTYPIVISPAGDTFGYTTIGGSFSALGIVNYITYSFNTTYTGAVGTGTSMSIYAKCIAGSQNAQCAVYNSSNSLIGNTGSIAVSSASGQWWSGNFVSNPTLSAVSYNLAFNVSSAFVLPYYNSTSGGYNQHVAQTFGTWPSSISVSYSTFLEQYSIYVTYTAGGGVSITNSPSSLAFGTVMPGTTYYAYNQSTGSYPNPVTSSQCYFTITNAGGSSVNLALSCTNATSGNTWTLVSGTPSGDQFKVIAVYNGENPASGLVLTNSNQSFYSALAASGTLLWDFKEVLGGTGTGKSGTFSDAATKTYTITITGS